MAVEATYDRVVQHVYEAALDPDQWCEALTSTASYIGCPIVAIVPLSNPAGARFSTGMESCAKPYAEYWWEKDCITHTALERKTRGLVCDWDLLSWERIATDAFYQEFRRELGIGHCCAYVSEIEPGALLGLGAHFDIGTLPSDEQFRKIRQMAQHVSRAAAIQEQANNASALAWSADVLSLFDCAAALVDHAGRVLHANDALRSLNGDGLTILGNRLCCASTRDQAALDRLIRNASSAADARDVDLALVARPSGLRPLLVRAMPLPKSVSEGAISFVGRRTLVLIVDLDAKRIKAPIAALRRLGLSPAEAMVAAIVGAGHPPRHAAVSQGVTEDTIRKHLKSIFVKLAVSRQTELVMLVSRLSVLNK